MWWEIFGGAALFLNWRRNNEMIARGIRPPWPSRHPILSTFLFLLFWIGVFLLYLVVLDLLFGQNGWIALMLTPPALIVWFAIHSYRSAEHRWNPPHPPSNPQVITTLAVRPKQRNWFERNPWWLAVSASVVGLIIWH